MRRPAAAGSAMRPPAPVPVDDAPVDQPFQPIYVAPPDDPNAILFGFQAWMPEAIAMIKLRGYVHDAQAEVLASEPGIVRVLLPGGGTLAPKSRLSWLGFVRSRGQSFWNCICCNRKTGPAICKSRPVSGPAIVRPRPTNFGDAVRRPLHQFARISDGTDGGRLNMTPRPESARGCALLVQRHLLRKASASRLNF